MSKKTILAADTDVPLIQALAVGLRSGGYEMVLAQNVDQVVERFGISAPDLLLLDVSLRGALDGIRAAGGGDTPVVFMTAEAAERVDAGTRRESVAVLHKPFDAKALLVTLGEAFGTAVRAPQV